MCALEPSANQQTEGDSLVHVLVDGFQEQHRSTIMNELRRFIKVDHEAVRFGDLEQNSVAIRVVGPNFNEDFQRQRSVKGTN